MNKKLVLAAAIVFGVVGLILAQGTVKAQDAMKADAGMEMKAVENMAMNAEEMNADAAMGDAGAMANAAENAVENVVDNAAMAVETTAAPATK